MGEGEIAEFLSHLAVERKVAASTQNQALSALLFLYQEVLARKLEFIAGVERVRQPARLPTVLTREEVAALLSSMRGEYRLMAELLYDIRRHPKLAARIVPSKSRSRCRNLSPRNL